MSRVEIHDANDNKWVQLLDMLTPEQRQDFKDKKVVSDIELDAPIRMHEAGDESTLQLFEIQVPPNTTVDTHYHDEDEIMYVVKGAMVLGKRSLGPGSSVFIPGKTLYGFKSGPEGLQFLNFRPRRDQSYTSREEYMEMRRQEKDRLAKD